MSAIAIETTVEEVAAAIYHVRLPLPFALNHVNCYLLQATPTAGRSSTPG